LILRTNLMEKVDLATAIRKLDKRSPDTFPKKTKIGTFIYGNFYVDVNIDDFGKINYKTRSGNILTELIVSDESKKAKVVVWGSDPNQRNLGMIHDLMPKRIRIIRPVRPSEVYRRPPWNVDLWVHEEISMIKVLRLRDWYYDEDEGFEDYFGLHENPPSATADEESMCPLWRVCPHLGEDPDKCDGRDDYTMCPHYSNLAEKKIIDNFISGLLWIYDEDEG